MAAPQRKMKAIIAKRHPCDPPIIAGMHVAPILPLGCSTQQHILSEISEAMAPSMEQSIMPGRATPWTAC